MTLPSPQPLLHVEDLSVRYGAVQAVQSLTLQVHRGELVTLLGANGAGKSSTLRALSGLVQPAGGEIRWQGEVITARRPETIVRRGIAHCPEGRRVLSRQSVASNLELGAWLRRDRSGLRADLERCYSLFPRLAERREQLAGSLSGGEQQMLAIARALMARPTLLLLDEPSLGLAPKLVAELMGVLADLHHQGLTMLLVEQNARAALKIADRGLVLDSGQISLAGPAEQLLANPQLRASYLGDD